MSSRQSVTMYWLALAILSVAVVGAFHQGQQRGIEIGKRGASSSETIANAMHASELVRALEAGRQREVRRGLDLMIDAGIATHYLRLQTPDAMADVDPSLQWDYAHLLEHRRRSPSTSRTEHIQRAVVAALGPSL